MKSREQTHLADLALGGELARQLCHDFNNFLYNLFLQMEIAKASPSAASAKDWDSIKSAGDKVVHRLRDWDRFHSRFSMDEMPVDLRLVLQQVADDVATESRRVEVGPATDLEKATSMVGAPVDMRHLLRLLIEEALEDPTGDGAVPAIISLNASQGEAKACVHIVMEATVDSSPDDGSHECLQIAACRSLAARLGADIRRQSAADGRLVIEVDFPLSLMNGKS